MKSLALTATVTMLTLCAFTVGQSHSGKALAQEEASGIPSRPTASSILVEDCIVRFGTEVSVPALQSGRVVAVNVKQNDPIVEGRVLARQDDADAILKRRAALWQKTAAEQQSQDQVDLKYANALYAEAVAQRDTDKTMFQKGGGTLQSLRESELRVERARLEIARADKTMRLAKIQLEIRKAELESIDEELNRLKIKAPTSGVVLKIERKAGEWIQEGETIAKIARMDRLAVDAFLNVADISPQKIGGCAVVASWDDGQQTRTLQGVVDSTDPNLLTGGRYRLHATITNQREGDSWVLLPGTEVKMWVLPLKKVHVEPSPQPVTNQASRGGGLMNRTATTKRFYDTRR